jgi:hypothetical protein
MLVTLRRLLFISACVAIAAPSNAQSTLHTSEEVIPNALLIQMNEQGQWAFDVNGKLKTVDNSAIVRWGAWPGSLQKSAVWLTDGSWLAGRVEFNSPQAITHHSDWFQSANI